MLDEVGDRQAGAARGEGAEGWQAVRGLLACMPAHLPPNLTHPLLQVAALLAGMEAAGLGFDPWLLGDAGRGARGHMARLEEEAATVAGRPFNLSSPQQLADVLYNVLKVGQGGSGSVRVGKGGSDVHWELGWLVVWLQLASMHSRLLGCMRSGSTVPGCLPSRIAAAAAHGPGPLRCQDAPAY